MVRVCLYLALALGLAGSAEGAACVGQFAATTYAAGATVSNIDPCVVGSANNVADKDACTLQCKNTHTATSSMRANEANALVYCNNGAWIKDITCTARKVQSTTKCKTAVTTAGASGDDTLQQCTAAKPGFYLKDDVATECTEQKGCKTSDKAVACVGTNTGEYHCKTTNDGYYIATDAGGISTVCAETAGSDGGRYGYQDSTTFPTFGIKCAKADGLLNTGKVTIDQCPPGAYKVVTKDADDKCMKCEESGNSRCHCTKTGGATSCLATGICNTGFWKYTGKAGEAGACTAHTACTDPVGKMAFPAGTETTDAVCVDCVAIPGAAATGITCTNLVKSNLVTTTSSCGEAGTGWTRKTVSTTPCVSDTCTCDAGSILATTDCSACTALTNVGAALTGIREVGATKTCSAAGAAGITDADCGDYKEKWVTATQATCVSCGATTNGAKPTPDCTTTQYEDTTQCSATVRSVCKDAGTVCTGQQLERGGATGGQNDANDGGTAGGSADAVAGALQGSAHECTSSVTASQTWSADLDSRFTLVVKGVKLQADDQVCIDDTACVGLTDCAGGVFVALAAFSSVNTAKTEATLSFAKTAAPLAAHGDYHVCVMGKNSYTAKSAVDRKLLVKAGTLTVKTATLSKKCINQEWDKSHPSCKVTAPASTGTTGSLAEFDSVLNLDVQTRHGFAGKCTVTCPTSEKAFTVVAAAACTAMEGCKTSDKAVACVNDKGETGKTDSDKYQCTTVAKGYYKQSGTALFKCTTGVGQEAEDCDASGLCWYQGKCKSGYTKTLGNAKKSDTCVSDSAASLSLTAVLLSVVAKVFLF